MRTAHVFLAAIASSLFTILALHLLTGTGATARPVYQEGDIAICDVASLAEDMMDSDRYLPAREAKQAELETKYLTPLREQATALEQQFVEAQAAGDQEKMQQISQQGMMLQQQGAEAQQNFQTELQQFISEQFQDAYSNIVESAAAVGDELGYTYVASSSPPASDFEDETFADLLTEVLSRTYVHYPEGVDITAEVRDDLNLDEE